MIWIKEHTVNKIPFVMSVTKFEIVRSGAKIITQMITFCYTRVCKLNDCLTGTVSRVTTGTKLGIQSCS